MIYIRMELWPKGNNAKASVLGEATISNSGGTPTRGVYEVVLSKKGGFKTSQKEATDQMRVLRPSETSVLRRGAVDGFPRKSSSAWNLLREALDSIQEDGFHRELVEELTSSIVEKGLQLRRKVHNRSVVWEIVAKKANEEMPRILQFVHEGPNFLSNAVEFITKQMSCEPPRACDKKIHCHTHQVGMRGFGEPK